MGRNKWIWVAFVLPVLSSCFEKEQAIEPFPRGDNKEAEIEMGSDYRYQAYFNLNTGQWLNKILKNTWDIAWSCSDTSNVIEINSGHGMWAAHSTRERLEDIKDTAGLIFQFDWPGGHPDSLAFSNWENLGGSWVFDMGFDRNGIHTGFMKATFKLLSRNQLEIHYATLTSTDIQRFVLNKDPDFLSVFFSFRNGIQEQIEPPAQNWDLVFRQFHHFFGEPDNLTYQVTGVFTNPGVEVAVDSGDFENYTAEMATKLFFSKRRDQIGYDWKEFTLNTGTYTVASNKIFLIRDRNGFLYKLHFVDFYNDNGESGTPAFVYKRL